ncbi:MAG: hypothetical protein HGA47_07565 [Zoogloea sp.]|nr:hypothetical protein [Zoogloea sp.]
MKFIKTSCLFGALLAAGIATAHAADWSDTSISYRYGKGFSEPAIAADVAKGTIGLTHVSGYKYGQNFFNVDVLKSDMNDPANGGAQGAQEIYLVYAHQLYLSKVTGLDLSFGPVKEVALTTGFDHNSKDSAFAPKVNKIMAGPTFKFKLPAGFFDAGLLYYKEWNNNSFGTTKDVQFDPTYRVALAWGVPFSAGPIPLSFEGFLNYTGAKGKNGFGQDTGAETWGDLFLMADIGKLVAEKPNTVKAGIGYEYIRNKFGETPDTAGAGTKTTTPMVKVSWGF